MGKSYANVQRVIIHGRLETNLIVPVVHTVHRNVASMVAENFEIGSVPVPIFASELLQ
jgi:hypothetical protein